MSTKPSEQCPRCSGTGICLDCNGTGRTLCPMCDGKSATEERKCKVCKNTGYISCSPECPSCCGTGFITGKMQEEVREKYTHSFSNFAPKRIAVSIFAILSIAIYILAPRDFTSLFPQPIPFLVWDTLVNKANVLSTMELWRFITPVFLHGNVWHLAANMYFLLYSGPALEGVLGTKRFIVLYILSAICGNILSWLFNPSAGIGASTALYGVGAAFVGIHWKWKMFDDEAVKQISYFLVGVVILGFIMGGTFGIALDNWGHIGGGLCGLALTYFGPRPKGE